MESDRVIPLVGDYVAQVRTSSELGDSLARLRPLVFGPAFEADPSLLMNDEERARTTLLRRRLDGLHELCWGIYHRDQLIGWTYGLQQSSEMFYMINTGILPEHQGKGIYSALLPHVLEQLRTDGFQIVTSRHVATNSRVIVPKLRAGFFIAGCELSDRFGLLVLLHYYTSPLRRRVVSARAGGERPDAAVLAALGIR
ncbi:MAG: GNAT family N-acetyltransferase [Candidatus Eisenbacteria bacterium]|nr:GNAT family N-acetyltransferase [Candidatus Eisenbacteria bacterium]